jgi:shikimate kinase
MSAETRSITLIGLSGAGKSTVGRLLAERFDWPLFDTDALITQLTGRSIPEIFTQDGEGRFREIETDALRRTLAVAPAVIATGGGIVLREENRALLRTHSFVVWLDAPTDALLARLLAHDEARPLLAGDDPATRLEALRTARVKLYAETAHVRIETNGLTAEVVCDQVVAAGLKG